MHQDSTTTPADSVAQLRAQVECLRQQLVQAQRLTALGELVSTTTHEFNNVLMTILNYAKLGLRHEDSATRAKAFDKILTAAQRAAKITHSVLGMARNRSDQFEATDLRAIIDETMVLMERELQKYRIAVDYELESVPAVRAIGNQIQQVLVNLLINARQAMDSGGRIVLRTRHDTAHDCVELTVRDYGTGIPAEILARIFEPHFSTKQGPDESGRGGSGLGLYACRNIIEAHGGKIRVESTVGKGTAFTIKLPVASTEPAAVVPAPVTIAFPTAASSAVHS